MASERKEVPQCLASLSLRAGAQNHIAHQSYCKMVYVYFLLDFLNKYFKL